MHNTPALDAWLKSGADLSYIETVGYLNSKTEQWDQDYWWDKDEYWVIYVLEDGTAITLSQS